MTKYVNNILIFRNEVATQDQIKGALFEFFKRANIKTIFDLRYDTDRDNKYRGLAYVFVKSEEAYNLLLGRNRDGSRRTREVENQLHATNAEEISELEESVAQYIADNFDSSSWGELTDIEEGSDRYIIDKYGPPMIEIELDPEVDLPNFRLSQQQQNTLRTKETLSFFEIERERPWKRDPNRIHHILFAQRVDQGIPLSFFESKFSALATSGYKIDEIINRSGRCLKVTFDRTTMDADRVLALFRKRILFNHHTKQSSLLIFNFCFNRR